MYEATIIWKDGRVTTITGPSIEWIAARMERMTKRKKPVSYTIKRVQEDKENGIHPAEH